MALECTSCGNEVPEGQFRCGRCGAHQEGGDTDDDLDSVGDLADLIAARPPSPEERESGEGTGDDEGGPAGPDTPEQVPPSTAPARMGAISLGPVPSLRPSPNEQAMLEPAVAPVEGAGAAPAESAEAKPEPPPTNPQKEASEETAKRKVPKGAFGEASVVGELPRAPDNEPEPEQAQASDPGRASAEPIEVERPPGFEPTRLGEEEPAPTSEAGQASRGNGNGNDGGNASELGSDATATGDAETDDAHSSGPELELDVPSEGLRSLPLKPLPPFLASQLMREELTPTRPAGLLANRTTVACGVAAVLVYGLLTLYRSDAGAWGLPGLILLAVGVAKLRFVQRAGAVATVVLGACLVTSWRGALPYDSGAAALVPFVILVLASGLWLRSWYRASRLSRGIVAGGVLAAAALGIGELSSTGAWELQGAWQSWLPALLGYAYLLLCLLSLLAFMGSDTRAAGGFWATLWVGWYAVAHIVLTIAGVSPLGSIADASTIANAVTDAGFISALLLPAGALALAQVYSVTMQQQDTDLPGDLDKPKDDDAPQGVAPAVG